MISKRQKRCIRGNNCKLVNVIYQEIQQLNNIFSTSTNSSCTRTYYYDSDGNWKYTILDDPLATQSLSIDRVIEWCNNQAIESTLIKESDMFPSRNNRWLFGTVSEFLELTPEEELIIEEKLKQ